MVSLCALRWVWDSNQHLKRGRRHESRYGASAHRWKNRLSRSCVGKEFWLQLCTLETGFRESESREERKAFISNYVCIFVSVQAYSAWDAKTLYWDEVCLCTSLFTKALRALCPGTVSRHRYPSFWPCGCEWGKPEKVMVASLPAWGGGQPQKLLWDGHLTKQRRERCSGYCVLMAH